MDEGSVEPFFTALAARAGTRTLSDVEAAAVLDLARVVAHTHERRLAPLTAYAAGLAFAAKDETQRISALRQLIATLTETTTADER